MTNPNLADARGMLGQSPNGDKAAAAKSRSVSDTANNKKDKKKRDEALEEGLEESFPASDPPAASQPTGRGPAGDPSTKP